MAVSFEFLSLVCIILCLFTLGQLLPHEAGSVPFSGKASPPALGDIFFDPLWGLSCVIDNLSCQINETLITP